MTKTKIEKLFTTLDKAEGANVRREKLIAKSGIANLSAAIDNLRQEGYVIYANRKGQAGEKYVAYRLAN